MEGGRECFYIEEECGEYDRCDHGSQFDMFFTVNDTFPLLSRV